MRLRKNPHPKSGDVVGCLLSVALPVLLSQSVLAGAADKPKGKTLGFVMTSFEKATYLGANDCPTGYVQRGIDGLLASVSKPERDRINRPENATERKKLDKLSRRGELCYEPQWLPGKPQRTSQGKISYGMDLDGGDTTNNPAPNTCPHDNFVGPNGETGIDNQYYRVTGCMDLYFRDGTKNVETNSYMRDGVSTNLMEITGVDDLRNDDDVMIGLYAGLDPMEVGVGDGTDVLPHATLEIDTNPRFAADKHVPVHGRIKDGILTSDPIDFIFRVPMPGEEAQYKFRGGRLKLELLPDGTAKGMIAAYYDVESAYWEVAVLGALGDTGYFCPSLYATLKKLADGYPDPKTGECTAISSAYTITAVPAFVIHPTPEQFAAAAAARKPELPYGMERLEKKMKELVREDNPFFKEIMEGHKLLEPIVERERARHLEASR